MKKTLKTAFLLMAILPLCMQAAEKASTKMQNSKITLKVNNIGKSSKAALKTVHISGSTGGVTWNLGDKKDLYIENNKSRTIQASEKSFENGLYAGVWYTGNDGKYYETVKPSRLVERSNTSGIITQGPNNPRPLKLEPGYEYIISNPEGSRCCTTEKYTTVELMDLLCVEKKALE